MSDLHITVFIELEGNALAPVSCQLLDEAFLLATGRAARVTALVLGNPADATRTALCRWPLERILHFPVEGPFRSDLYCRLFLTGIRQLSPDIALIGSTPQGRVLASHAAAMLRTGVTADCTELSLTEEGRLLQCRPAFGGNLMAQILTKTAPQLAIVRPGALTPPNAATGGCPIWETPDADVSSVIAVKNVTSAPASSALSDAQAIIAVGRGFRKKEDLEPVRELADLLGASLACSRAVVEMGWLSPEYQIGLSGQSVAPQWLLTLGISGSIQFRSGIRGVKRLIAVNQNPEAPILQIADVPICGDVYRVVPALLEATRSNT